MTKEGMKVINKSNKIKKHFLKHLCLPNHISQLMYALTHQTADMNRHTHLKKKKKWDKKKERVKKSLNGSINLSEYNQ